MLSEDEVLARRLAGQRLSTPGLANAAEVVGLLCAVQSQEWAHGFWSLGMRTEGLSFEDVKAEFDAGAILRTHVLRPTWHFVLPADLHWLLELTAPRVHRRNAGMYRSHGLDPATLDRAATIMLDALSGTPLTRAELGTVLTDSGVEASGSRLAHLVMWAELEALICSGSLRGTQHTYARVDERTDPAVTRHPAEPLAELAMRFLAGHGPATVADLARWASLTLTDARTAVAAIEDQLDCARVSTASGEEIVWWISGADSEPLPDHDPDRVWWLPLYDELTLSYPAIGFRTLPGHPVAPGEDVFIGSMIAGRDVIGLWKRTVQGRKVKLDIRCAPGVGSARTVAVRAEGERMAVFLSRTPVW